MRARNFYQFSLRSALVSVTLIAIMLGMLPWIQAAREAARRRACSKTLVHHSGFHGPGCSICKRSLIGILRASPGFTNDIRVRTLYVEIATPYAHADEEVLSALSVASKDKSAIVRQAASAALKKIEHSN
jgi:hypothetical protein